MTLASTSLSISAFASPLPSDKLETGMKVILLSAAVAIAMVATTYLADRGMCHLSAGSHGVAYRYKAFDGCFIQVGGKWILNERPGGGEK